MCACCACVVIYGHEEKYNIILPDERTLFLHYYLTIPSVQGLEHCTSQRRTMGGGMSTSSLASLTVEDVAKFDFVANKLGYDYQRIIREHNVDGAYLSHPGIRKIEDFLEAIGVENPGHIEEFTKKLTAARAGVGGGNKTAFPTTPSSSSYDYRNAPFTPGGYNSAPVLNPYGTPTSHGHHGSSPCRFNRPYVPLRDHIRRYDIDPAYRQVLINDYNTLAKHSLPVDQQRPTWELMSWDEDFVDKGWTIVFLKASAPAPGEVKALPFNLAQFDRSLLAPYTEQYIPPLSLSPPLSLPLTLPLTLPTVSPSTPAAVSPTPVNQPPSRLVLPTQLKKILLQIFPGDNIPPSKTHPLTSAPLTATHPLNPFTFPTPTPTTHPTTHPTPTPTPHSEPLGRPRSVHPALWTAYVNSPNNHTPIRGYLSPLGNNAEIFLRVSSSFLSSGQAQGGERRVGRDLVEEGPTRGVGWGGEGGVGERGGEGGGEGGGERGSEGGEGRERARHHYPRTRSSERGSEGGEGRERARHHYPRTRSTCTPPLLGDATIGAMLLATRLHLTADTHEAQHTQGHYTETHHTQGRQAEAHHAEKLYLTALKGLQELDHEGVWGHTVVTAGSLGVLRYERYTHSEGMVCLEWALARQEELCGDGSWGAGGGWGAGARTGARAGVDGCVVDEGLVGSGVARGWAVPCG